MTTKALLPQLQEVMTKAQKAEKYQNLHGVSIVTFCTTEKER